jgi:hypothetical protein
MEARTFITPGDHDDDLARVVARIRATNGGPPVSTPSADTIASVIAHLQGEDPLSDADLAEHERLWREVEDEMRRRDQADDRAEGLL